MTTPPLSSSHLTLTEMSKQIGSFRLATDEQFNYFDTKYPSNNIKETFKSRFQQDLRTLKKLGVTTRQIADRLKVITLKAEQLLKLDPNDSNPHDNIQTTSTIGKGGSNSIAVLYNGQIEVKRTYILGKNLDCPFTLKNSCGKYLARYTITNTQLKETIHLMDMQVNHVIPDHEFFGRTGSYFRVDPALICRVIGLFAYAVVNDSKAIKKRLIWRLVDVSMFYPKSHLKHLRSNSVSNGKVGKDSCAFLMHSGKIDGFAPSSIGKTSDLFLHIIAAKSDRLEEESSFKGASLPKKWQEGLSVYKLTSELFTENARGDHLRNH